MCGTVDGYETNCVLKSAHKVPSNDPRIQRINVLSKSSSISAAAACVLCRERPRETYRDVYYTPQYSVYRDRCRDDMCGVRTKYTKPFLLVVESEVLNFHGDCNSCDTHSLTLTRTPKASKRAPSQPRWVHIEHTASSYCRYDHVSALFWRNFEYSTRASKRTLVCERGNDGK